MANRKIASLWVIQKSLWATPVYMWKKLGKTVEKDVASSDHILRNVAIATKSACGESGKKIATKSVENSSDLGRTGVSRLDAVYKTVCKPLSKAGHN